MSKLDDNSLLTSNLELVINDSKLINSLNIYQYWINSSHNTYLPYNQITDSSSLCYYELISSIYYGGCIEIDIFNFTDDLNDIIVNHLLTNSKSILLSDIIRICTSAIKRKKTKPEYKYSGPLILIFDNKFIKSNDKIELLKKIIINKLVDSDIEIVIMDNNIDLTSIKLSDMAYKIIIIWNFYKTQNDTKYHSNFINNNNYISISHLNAHNKINDYVLLNSLFNFIRIYPPFYNIFSNNFSTIKYLKSGVNMTAINVQTIDNHWFFNKAIFNSNKPYAYRLKPLWLLGLVPHPGIYTLTLKIISTSLKNTNLKSKITYGLLNKSFAFNNVNEIIIKGIDPTVPYFKLSINNYHNGLDLVWCLNNVNVFETIKLKLFKPNIDIFNFNKINLSKHDSCNNELLYDENNFIECDIQYKYEKESDIDINSKLSETINETRNSEKFNNLNLKDILFNVDIFNEYQQTLKNNYICKSKITSL